MDEAARLLAQCVDAPDDDGPRLAWADLVGGDRGELVVIQCDLARGQLSPPEVAIRRQRERELLDRNAVEWAGTVSTIAKRWAFRRGFVEAAHLELSKLDPSVLSTWPLLASLTIEAADSDEVAPLADYVGSLRGFGLSDANPREHNAAWLQQLARSSSMRALRALGCYGIDDQTYVPVLEIARRAPLERLRLRGHRIGHPQLAALLDVVPDLAVLELDRAVPLELVMHRPLRALRLGNVDERDLPSLETGACAETLEHLRLAGTPRVIETLPRFARLRTLELRGSDEQLAAMAKTLADTKLPALRRLALGRGVAFRDAYLIAERFGPQLEELELAAPVTVEEQAVHAHLVERIAGELRIASAIADAKFGGELLHASPAAAFTLGRPSCDVTEPATLVRLDRPAPMIEIPAVPITDKVTIGRATNADICIVADTLARRHAALCWRSGHHHIVDMGSASGLWVNGDHNSPEPLRDGDRIQVGNLYFEYYRGTQARLVAPELDAARRLRARRVAFAATIRMAGDPDCNRLLARISFEPASLVEIARAFASWVAELDGPASELIAELDALASASTIEERDRIWMRMFSQWTSAGVRCVSRMSQRGVAGLESSMRALLERLVPTPPLP